ncbi:glycoside hydrolase family 1 protein [Nakamurella flava]|uniref:glycoside hydrolase family 1 protein n=1 Tax=Nakamurella flava TaxID=2576308 RepID=UPI00140A5542|nr:family 1 glycosylhydrolase [Nakamurella flava]
MTTTHSGGGLGPPGRLLVGTTSSAVPWEGSAGLPDGWPAAGSGSDTTTPGAAALTVWDVFGALPGRIADGTAPTTGAGGVERLDADLDLLAELGVRAHRVTLSWARLAPQGQVDPGGAGSDFYRRLLDGLRDRGIAPWVALHHWDLPLSLMEQGGWLARETAHRFADYAAAAAAAFGDRVAAWTTVDEPATVTALGYGVGIDAPGLTLLGGAFSAAHHQLLAHGHAVTALRAAGAVPVGIVNAHTVVRPHNPGSTADQAVARFVDLYLNRQFADPVLRGRYPRALHRSLPEMGDETLVHDGDLAVIGQPLDFYGVSWDHPLTVAAVPENRSVPFSLETPDGLPLTTTGRPVDPQGLQQTLSDLSRRYPDAPPLIVAASGGAFAARTDGADEDRIAFLDAHLAATEAAREAGSDVRAYFHRSLLDGWEWTDGWSARYGLVAVDRETGHRVRRPAFTHLQQRLAERPLQD